MDRKGPLAARVFVLVVALMVQVVATRSEADATPPSNPASAVRLGAKNIITGSQTAAVRVRVPVRSSVSLLFLEPNPDISVTGKGRLGGIVLTRSDVDNFRRPTLAAIRAQFCAKPECDPSAFNLALFERGGFAEGETGELPSGTYILYLVADGSPLRVVLRLHGPTGNVRLRPRTPADSETYVPPRHGYVDATKTVYWDGRVIEALGGSLWTFSAHRIRGRSSNGGKFSVCIYYGEPPPPPVGFAPGCPGGFGVSTVITRIGAPSGSYDHIHHGGAMMSPGGTWGYGWNYVTTGFVDSVQSVAAYIDFQSLP